MTKQNTTNSSCQLNQIEKEFDDFLTNCANCPECEEYISDNCICPDHSSEWEQIYKHHYELIKLQKGDSV